MSYMTPIYAFFLTCAGAGLAALWLVTDRWIIALSVVLALALISLTAQSVGSRQVKSRPRLALYLLEARAILVGTFTTLAGAAAIILVVKLAVPDGASEETASILGTLSAGLAGFLSTLLITADSMDRHVGDFIRQKFQTTYLGVPPEAPQENGKVGLLRGGSAHRAIQSSVDFGFSDWSRSFRHKRIDKLVEGINDTPSQKLW